MTDWRIVFCFCAFLGTFSADICMAQQTRTGFFLLADGVLSSVVEEKFVTDRVRRILIGATLGHNVTERLALGLRYEIGKSESSVGGAQMQKILLSANHDLTFASGAHVIGGIGAKLGGHGGLLLRLGIGIHNRLNDRIGLSATVHYDNLNELEVNDSLEITGRFSEFGLTLGFLLWM